MALSKQRRSLSTVRSHARIDAEGESGAADGLRAALAAGTDDATAQSLTHEFHTYPARMHPATARALIGTALEGPRRKRRSAPAILDPFCGSGTVMVEARFAGGLALGVDSNPLAVLVARAKTWTGDDEKRGQLLEAAADIKDAALEAGKVARRSKAGRAPEPPSPEQRRRTRAFGQWFAPHVRAELETLRRLIGEYRVSKAGNPAIADVLTAALSSVLYKVSKRQSDTTDEPVDRNVARGASARLFEQRVQQLFTGLEDLAAVASPAPRIVTGDARDLLAASIKEASVDAIVTSPPYAGTYDYLDYQALRMKFLELEDDKRGSEVGARAGFRGGADARRRAMERFEKAVAGTLRQMALALRPGGRAAIVTGDSFSGPAAIFTRPLYEAARPPELDFVAAASQTRPLLSATEKRAFGQRDKREYILLFERRAD